MVETDLPNLITPIEDFAQCDQIIRSRLGGTEPVFLARIGGSDTDLIIDYYRHRRLVDEKEALAALQPQINLLKSYNGYYDFSEDPANITRFYRDMTRAYASCPDLFVVGGAMLTQFLPSTINPVFHTDSGARSDAIHDYFFEELSKHSAVRLFPYSYVERINLGQYTMFRAFADILPGKRVLVVSPFSNSIETNFSNRQYFLPNYKYPDFQLLTYNTPITYAGLPPEFYPDADWFATADRMVSEISTMQFDIALLACGSYSIPVGMAVRDLLRKKAVYVGGCMQLYFGVMGRRYENTFFQDQINRESYIYPLEKDWYFQHVKVSPQGAAEAFGAYF